MIIVLERDIAASRRVAWDTFAAVDRWPEWSPWALRFDGRPELGPETRFQVVVPAPLLPWIKLSFPCQVEEFNAGKKIRWTGTVVGVPGYHQFVFEDHGAACRVISEERFNGTGAKVLASVRSMFIRRVEHFLDCFIAATDRASQRGAALDQRGLVGNESAR